MAWIFLVNGYNFIIKNDEKDLYSFENTKEFLDIVEELKIIHPNLILNSSVNTDSGELNVFIGAELSIERHIYQGETLCAEKLYENLLEDTQFLNCVEKIKMLIKKEYGQYIEKKGIILNQFD